MNQDEKFPNVKALGLEVYYSDSGNRVVYASCLEKLLSQAPMVWFNDDKTMLPYWECSSRQDKKHTHTARLVCIEPIVKESEERKLLREYLHAFGELTLPQGLHERARKLLGDKA